MANATSPRLQFWDCIYIEYCQDPSTIFSSDVRLSLDILNSEHVFFHIRRCKELFPTKDGVTVNEKTLLHLANKITDEDSALSHFADFKFGMKFQQVEKEVITHKRKDTSQESLIYLTNKLTDEESTLSQFADLKLGMKLQKEVVITHKRKDGTENSITIRVTEFSGFIMRLKYFKYIALYRKSKPTKFAKIIMTALIFLKVKERYLTNKTCLGCINNEGNQMAHNCVDDEVNGFFASAAYHKSVVETLEFAYEDVVEAYKKLAKILALDQEEVFEECNVEAMRRIAYANKHCIMNFSWRSGQDVSPHLEFVNHMVMPHDTIG